MATVDEMMALFPGTLPGLLGVELTELREGYVRARMEVTPGHLAPNGYLHAASVIALVDTACGFGCRASLPEGATGFTTIEVKSNYVGTAREGAVTCEATMAHGGRTTQVWDATATAGGRPIAFFRCTQMVLSPR